MRKDAFDERNEALRDREVGLLLFTERDAIGHTWEKQYVVIVEKRDVAALGQRDALSQKRAPAVLTRCRADPDDATGAGGEESLTESTHFGEHGLFRELDHNDHLAVDRRFVEHAVEGSCQKVDICAFVEADHDAKQLHSTHRTGAKLILYCGFQ